MEYKVNSEYVSDIYDSKVYYPFNSTTLGDNNNILTPFTDYYIKIVAYNNYGGSILNSTTCKTLPTGIYYYYYYILHIFLFLFICIVPEPAKITSELISNTTISLNWIASTNTGGIPLEGYNIIIYENGIRKDEIINITQSNINSYLYSDITRGSTYEFTIISVNSYGSSAESSKTTPITIEVPLPPDIITCNAIDRNSLSITWSQPNRFSFEPYADKYIIKYSFEVSSSSLESEEINNENIQINYVLVNLEIGKNYSINIKSGNIVGYGNYSDKTIYCQTHTGPPPPPLIVNAIQVDGNDCYNISWIHDYKQYGIYFDISYYIITIQNENSPDQFILNTDNDNLYIITCDILKGNRRYVIKVKGKCVGDNESTDDSNYYYLTTNPMKPDPVEMLKRIYPGHYSEVFQYPPPYDNGDAITQ